MAGMSTRLRYARTKTQALFSSFQLKCTSWLVPNVPDGSRFPIPRHLRKTMTTANYKRLVLAKTAFQDGGNRNSCLIVSCAFIAATSTTSTYLPKTRPSPWRRFRIAMPTKRSNRASFLNVGTPASKCHFYIFLRTLSYQIF